MSNTTWTPVQYWRQSKKWSRLLGQRGTVLSITYVHVSEETMDGFTPYPLVLVALQGGGRRLFVGEHGSTVSVGDTVECVLRRMAIPDESSVLPYGVKVRPVSQKLLESRTDQNAATR